MKNNKILIFVGLAVLVLWFVQKKYNKPSEEKANACGCGK